ncbi:hypothetical protein L208DRAFT_1247378, partial [Tricholoma matsutake]
WHPPNPYYSIHCMRSMDCIIWYSVAYLCAPVCWCCHDTVCPWVPSSYHCQPHFGVT